MIWLWGYVICAAGFSLIVLAAGVRRALRRGWRP